jgi:hypothetical protein
MTRANPSTLVEGTSRVDGDAIGSRVIVGNANSDGAGATRGWFVGHFVVPRESPRCTSSVEVKWGVHPAGYARSQMAMATEATTLAILVTGAFRVIFPGQEVHLSCPGDYVLYPPRLPHRSVADEDSVVVTVRWPSKPGDAVEHPQPPT